MITNGALNRDSSPQTADNAAFLSSYNCKLSEDKRSRVNEKGFTYLFTVDEGNPDVKINGTIDLPDGGIVFACNTTYSYIMRIYYDEELNIFNHKFVAYRDERLGFSIDFPITGEFTYNFRNELIINFIEGNIEGANQPRSINIDKILSGKDILDYDSINTAPILTNPSIVADMAINEGNMPVGVQYYTIRYIDDDDVETNYTKVIGPYPIINGSYDINSIRGGLAGSTTNQAIKLAISNLSSKFTKFRLYIAHYNGTSYSYYQTGLYYYSGTKSSIVLTNLDTLNTASYDTMMELSIAIKRAHAVTKMNNLL